MAWGSISLFAGFLEKENSLETLIVIFKEVSPKGFFWLIMKNFEISLLTPNSRYLQTAALKARAIYYNYKKFQRRTRQNHIFCVVRDNSIQFNSLFHTI